MLGHLLDYSKSGHIDNDDQPSQPYSKTMPSIWQALVNCVLEIGWMYTEEGLGNNLSLLWNIFRNVLSTYKKQSMLDARLWAPHLFFRPHNDHLRWVWYLFWVYKLRTKFKSFNQSWDPSPRLSNIRVFHHYTSTLQIISDFRLKSKAENIVPLINYPLDVNGQTFFPCIYKIKDFSIRR